MEYICAQSKIAGKSLLEQKRFTHTGLPIEYVDWLFLKILNDLGRCAVLTTCTSTIANCYSYNYVLSI